MIFIYKITNLANGKKYVGQSVRPSQRFVEHYKYSYGNSLISKAMKKYGIDKFILEVLEKCLSEDQANEREIYWIDAEDTLSPFGYNLEKGGRGGIPSSETREKISRAAKQRIGPKNPFFGKKHSEESKKKIALSRLGKGHPHTEETKRKMRELPEEKRKPWLGCTGKNAPRFGARLSEETKDKIRKAHTGKKLSKEHKQKIGQGGKGRKVSEETKKKISEIRRLYWANKKESAREEV